MSRAASQCVASQAMGLRVTDALSRQLTAAAFLLAALPASFHATAQATPQFPSKPLRLIVPFPAGGPVDLTARTIAQKLTAALGQPVLVDNRARASTIIGTDIVAKAPPDGYTWLIVSNGIAINPSIFKKLPYDTLADLAPVTLISTSRYLLVVHPSLPTRSVTELVKLAKARPGELTYSSSGIGSGNHLAGALFSFTAGINTTHVPYKGSVPSLGAVVGGEVQFQFSNPIASVPLSRAGKLRALATSGSSRLPFLPELPTIAESGLPGFEAGQWFGLYTAVATPRPIIERMHREVELVLAMPSVRQILSAEGAEMIASTPEQFAAFTKAEIAKWAKVVRYAGVAAE